MDTAQELLKMKEEIDGAKSKKSRLEGQLENYMAELKKLGCNSIEEAKEKLEKLEKQEETNTKKLEKAIEDLRESYEWETL